MTLLLSRFCYSHDRTLGWLTFESLRLATLERPWIQNPLGPGGKPRQSCIPDGSYTLRPHDSDRWHDVYELVNPALGVYSQPQDIPEGQKWGRSAILIHPANRPIDVVGCIAVGVNHGYIMNDGAVIGSQVAMARLRQTLGSGTYEIKIVPVLGAREAA